MTLQSELITGILLARRARYLSSSLWLILIVISLSLMAAQFSGRQPATVALDIGLSSARLLLPFLIILLIQELFSKEFDRRYYLTSLTYPRPRHKLFVGRLVSTLLLSYAALLSIAATLAWVTTLIASSYEQSTPVNLGYPYWITISFIALDLFVITTMAALLSVVASTPSFVLIGTLGFMVISRSYSTVIDLLEQNRYLFDNTELYQQSLGVLHYLMPDLASLDVRIISLYDKTELLPADWLFNLTASTSYGIALVGLALIFLHRKQFN